MFDKPNIFHLCKMFLAADYVCICICIVFVMEPDRNTKMIKYDLTIVIISLLSDEGR